MGSLQVTVHSSISGRPLLLAVDRRGVGQGLAYVNEDPRPFYLVIQSNNVDWSIAVEEPVGGSR